MQNTALKIKEQSQPPVITSVPGNYARGAFIPWQVKMWIKILLSQLPLSDSFLSGLGIFRHGSVSRDLDNLYRSFADHLDAYRQQTGRTPEACLELGPGDSIGHAMCAKAEGVQGMYMVDAGDFATRDENHYRAFASYLTQKGRDPGMTGYDRQSVLNATNAEYFLEGLKSMPAIPANAVDLSFSQAVFEHIPRAEFLPYMKELFRVHKPGSLSRHIVDLHDHLGGALNSLRFSQRFWESSFVRGAGFYTNRLTMAEMIEYAIQAGFTVRIEEIVNWPGLPTPRAYMNKLFRDKTEEELNICTFTVTLEKPSGN
jgi:hypothetical protein